MGQATLINLGACVVQAVAIAAVVVLAVHALRLSAPGVRLACWRFALAACLLMPWVLRQPATPAVAPLTVGGADPAALSVLSVDPIATAAIMPGDAHGFPLTWGSTVALVLLTGALVRGVWLLIGWLRLCRVRRQSIPFGADEYDDIQQTLGTHAALHAVPGLNQPATFGVVRPVVLLPASLADAPSARRRAVVTHELFHVQRRDWTWMLAEEILRTVLWFHPAVLWLTSRIQLAREELVDELTVLATGDRRAYIETLLAFADAEPMRPAPAFARRPHLFTRIVGLSKERVMSSPRVVLSSALVVIAVVTCGWAASQVIPVLSAATVDAAPGDDVLLSPIEATPPAPTPAPVRESAQGGRSGGAARPGPVTAPAPAQPAAVGNRVTPENPIPRRTYSVPVTYPQELQGSGYRAAVEVGLLIDASGVPTVLPNRRAVAVSQVNLNWLAARTGIEPSAAPAPLEVAAGQLQALVLQQKSAQEAFVTAVVAAVQQWRYDAPAEPPLAFWVSVLFGPDPTVVVTQAAESRGVSSIGGTIAVGTFNTGGPVDPAGRVPNTALAELDRQQLDLTKRRGDLVLRLSPQHPDVAALDAQLAALAARRAALVGELQKASAQSAGAAAIAPVRVGGNIKPPAKTRHVNPVYPADALEQGVAGVVILEVTIAATGNVSNARVLRSVPLLDQAAVDAVRQWEFTPTLLNGAPVPVLMTVTVQFSPN